jgi:hypothetical protein
MKYCVVRISIQLEQVNLHDRKTSNLITLALSSIVVLIGVVVIGLTMYLKKERYQYLNRLYRILERKKRARG